MFFLEYRISNTCPWIPKTLIKDLHGNFLCAAFGIFLEKGNRSKIFEYSLLHNKRIQNAFNLFGAIFLFQNIL